MFAVDTSALVLLDCQNRIVHPKGSVAQAMGLAAEIERRDVLGTIAKLLGAARAAGLPVVHVVIDPTVAPDRRVPATGDFNRSLRAAMDAPPAPDAPWQTAIHDLCAPRDGEPVIGKFPISGFAHSALEATLREKGIDALILAGVATHMVVEMTARDGSDLGFDIHVVEDATAASSQEVHERALDAMTGAADIVNAETVLGALA